MTQKNARAAAAAALGLAMLSLLSIAPASAQLYGGAPYASYANPYRYRLHRAARQRNTNRRTTSRRASGTTGTTGKSAAASKPKVDLKTVLDQLKLTPAQKSKTDLYQAKADAAGKVAYADRTLSPDQYIAKMDKIHEDLMNDIKGILTPEQKPRFDSLMAGVK